MTVVAPRSRRTARKHCWRCHADFLCGPETGKANCWCDELPAIGPSLGGVNCLCPACLNDEVVRQRGDTVSLPQLRPAAEPSTKTKNFLVEGEDYYREGATIVFTAQYHRRRGYCCGSGCRHCPYAK